MFQVVNMALESKLKVKCTLIQSVWLVMRHTLTSLKECVHILHTDCPVCIKDSNG